MRIRNKNDSHLSSGMCDSILDDITDIKAQLEGYQDSDLPTWWVSKLAVASAYINSLRDYMTYDTSDMEEEGEEDETAEDEAEEGPEEQASEMAAGTEQPIDSDDMIDIADEMLPPSARMMKNAAKTR